MCALGGDRTEKMRDAGGRDRMSKELKRERAGGRCT